MSNNETWQCNGCDHNFVIQPSHAVDLFEFGCAYCGCHKFALVELVKEVSE